MQLGKSLWQQQLASFTQKIELKPNNPDHYLERGHFFFQYQQLDLAIVDYSMAIDLNPERFESYNSRGIAYSEKKLFRQALYDLHQAVKLAPTIPTVYVNRGIAYCLCKDYDLGISDYCHAISLWMGQPCQQQQRWSAYHNRAVAYRELKQDNTALADMLRALILSPAQSILHLDLAKLYHHCGSHFVIQFFNSKLKTEEIIELQRLHHCLGQGKLSINVCLKLYQNLLSIYSQTTYNSLISSLHIHSKYLQRKKCTQ